MKDHDFNFTFCMPATSLKSAQKPTQLYIVKWLNFKFNLFSLDQLRRGCSDQQSCISFLSLGAGKGCEEEKSQVWLLRSLPQSCLNNNFPFKGRFLSIHKQYFTYGLTIVLGFLCLLSIIPLTFRTLVLLQSPTFNCKFSSQPSLIYMHHNL